MNELLSGIADTVSKRASSPFLLSFFLSWPFCNYKTIIVLLSDESYRAKFQYIEAVIYGTPTEAALRLLAYPITAAIFYTFIWPILDTEIGVISQKLLNRKQLRLLKEQRKEPIDRDEQARFFEKFDQELTDYKARLNAIHNREVRLKTNHSQTNGRLHERLKRQALLRMAEHAGVGYADIVNILNCEAWVIRDSHPDLLAAVKRIPQLQKIQKFITASESIASTPEFRKMSNIGWLGTTLQMDSEQARDFLEILYATSLASETPEEIENFEILHFDTERIAKITQLVDLQNSP